MLVLVASIFTEDRVVLHWGAKVEVSVMAAVVDGTADVKMVEGMKRTEAILAKKIASTTASQARQSDEP